MNEDVKCENCGYRRFSHINTKLRCPGRASGNFVPSKGETTDPAVDPAARAAQQAIGDITRSEPYRWAERGAREMARPIRQLVENCEAFGDELDIDDLKKLIYPTEELES